MTDPFADQVFILRAPRRNRVLAWLRRLLAPIGEEPALPDATPGRPYLVTVWEQGRVLGRTRHVDPFFRTVVRPRGWRAALLVLLRRYQVEVCLDADPELMRRVLNLNPVYRD